MNKTTKTINASRNSNTALDNDSFVKAAMLAAERDARLTEMEKARILNNILTNCEADGVSTAQRLKTYFCVKPWRAAFLLSALQTAVCTAIFGVNYTNFVLSMFGG